MLGNFFGKQPSKVKANANVLADLRKVLKAGRRICFLHDGELMGRAIVVAIEEHRLLFEPLNSINELMGSTVASNLEQGVPWDFPLAELTKVTEGSDTYLQANIPPQVNISSRREKYRVAVPLRSKCNFHFQIDDNDLVGRVMDLSEGGVQIIVEGLPKLPLDDNKTVHHAILNLGENDALTLDVNLCWVVSNEKGTRVGIRFLNATEADTDQIHHLVCEIEREMIRKLKALE